MISLKLNWRKNYKLCWKVRTTWNYPSPVFRLSFMTQISQNLTQWLIWSPTNLNNWIRGLGVMIHQSLYPFIVPPCIYTRCKRFCPEVQDKYRDFRLRHDWSEKFFWIPWSLRIVLHTESSSNFEFFVYILGN